MNATQKIFSAGVLVSFFLASAVSALADPLNYGMRNVRITSKCPTLPDVPPPLVTDANCPTVPTLGASPNGRWSVDISWFDPDTQKFYLADRNNFGIDIIDTNTDQVVGFAGGFVGIQPGSNTSGPNGVLTTTNPRQLWAGDGQGLVRVFSLDANGLPLTQLTPLSAGGQRRADEMAFDPDDHMVLVAWDDDKDLFVAFFSVSSTPTFLGKITIPEAATCGIEQPVYNHATGKFYLAIPCTNAVNAANQNTAVHQNGEIAVIDPKSKSIVNVFPLDNTGCYPHGLALGPRNNLLLGCSGDTVFGNHAMISIIMRATDGAILQTFNQLSGPNTQLGGSDEVWFNPGDNHYYLAMSSWTSNGSTTGGTATPSLGIINAGSADGGASWVQNIPTTRTSHSVAAVYATQCEDNNGNGNGNNGKGNVKSKGKGNGNGNGNGGGNGNNGESECQNIRNRVYVPLTTVSVNVTDGKTPPTITPTIIEPGGIGVYGQIP